MSRKTLSDKEYIEKYGYEEGMKRIKKREYSKQYRLNNKEYIAAYRAVHKEQIAERKKEYYTTQFGRATILIGGYKRSDNLANRGDCTITPEWVVNHIFTSKCVYCGESDWTKLGCDRIDNSQPHIPSNVVCCCGKCNVERNIKDIDVFKQIKTEVA